MNGKQALLLTVGLTFMAAAAFGAVTISDTGAKEVRVNNYSRVNRTVTFNNNGPVAYNLSYSYINDPEYTKENPKAVLPQIGDPSAYTTGLGLNSSWYQSGFLGIEINGKSLNRTIAKEFKVVEQGKRGVYDIIWSPEWGDVRARFVSMQDDNKLYLEVSVDPKVQVSSLKLKFACMPGGVAPKKDEWFSTAERNVQHSPDIVAIDTKKEPWILFYDTQNTSAGTCALAYVPEEVSNVKVDISANWTTYTFVSYPASTRKMHIVLYVFPEKYKSMKESLSLLKENGSDILAGLKNVDFGK
jgi:hypothetical protein